MEVPMSWMRASIGVGGVGLLAGVAGMLLWINDGSNYFGVAVALASAGFLTLVACVLARVFGSSHGSQDDAFKRGREMGYDSGYLEGRRTSKPVVVPMLRVVGGDKDAPLVPREPHRRGATRDQEMPLVAREDQMPGVARDQHLRGVARDQELQDVARDQEHPASDLGVRDLEHVDGTRFTPPILPVWSREAPDELVGWDRVVAWMRPRRIPLLAGVVSLALLGIVLIGTAMARPSAPVEASPPTPGSPSDQTVSSPLFDRTTPSRGATPALVPRAVDPRAAIVIAAGVSPLAKAKADLSPGVPVADANVASVLVSGAPVQASAPTGTPDVATVAPEIRYLPAVTTPSVEPVVAPPAVPLTAAEQTAADAAAAAALTAANAAAAADLTAANAASAANLTAANAAAAAAATAQAAADAAWTVAHP